MGKYFGTDGIRGVPWNFPFTPDFIRKIGYCSSYVIKKDLKPSGRDIFIGMDSRESGHRIKKYLAEGAALSGFKIIDAGILTTPGLSALARKNGAAFAVMISASHNPPEFNGIKIFSPEGKKTHEEIELKIEKMLHSSYAEKDWKKKAEMVKKDFSGAYEDFVVSSLPPGFSLKGLKICLDCANGGGYKLAPEIFRRLGADLVLMGAKPDGRNINQKCGALATEGMRKKTVAARAFCGVSLDGDGDRCILSDENGRIFDGDDIIYSLASFLKSSGKLKKSSVVLTVMANLGLRKAMGKKGIKTIIVPVGDKNVTEAIDRGGLSLGGESSGHIILRELGPSGDGIVSSLWTIYAALHDNKKLSALKNEWVRYPQSLKAVKASEKIEMDHIPGFQERVKELEKKIKGRILVRYSGTEPVLRILAEGEKEKAVETAAAELAESFSAHAKNLKV